MCWDVEERAISMTQSCRGNGVFRETEVSMEAEETCPKKLRMERNKASQEHSGAVGREVADWAKKQRAVICG